MTITHWYSGRGKNNKIKGIMMLPLMWTTKTHTPQSQKQKQMNSLFFRGDGKWRNTEMANKMTTRLARENKNREISKSQSIRLQFQRFNDSTSKMIRKKKKNRKSGQLFCQFVHVTQSESFSRLHLARRFLNQNWTFFGSNLGNFSRYGWRLSSSV